ncbi:MAG: tripartite tricarboxylate transporter substrate binding protein [Limnohabitans sp.]|jgi:tripartite-type tricarboxylate transporter receptor subunit TctC|nr:tripartite tricarboxylate transporter substrate binding protein [Limnohabitans sp.]
MTSLMRWWMPLALSLGAFSGTLPAFAQSRFPDHPIRFVVPFPPGGGNDILARAIAPKMGEFLGQPVVIDNKAGAGGNIGTDLVAKSPPDGYTIVIASNQITINPWLYSKLPFDIERDFTPVAQAASVPMVLVVHPSVAANNLREFIALVKAQPDKFNHSTPGDGTPQHIAFEVFNHAAGIKVTHVPYKGTGPAIADLLAGQVQAAIGTMASLEQHVKAGKLRALGVTTPKRSQTLPQVPTLAEAGLPGFEVPLWYSILAPANTPKEVVNRLSSDIAKSLATPEIRDRLTGQGFEVNYLNAEQMNDLIKRDMLRWQKSIRDIGLKMD